MYRHIGCVFLFRCVLEFRCGWLGWYPCGRLPHGYHGYHPNQPEDGQLGEDWRPSKRIAFMKLGTTGYKRNATFLSSEGQIS